jgi:hypothetical protein
MRTPAAASSSLPPVRQPACDESHFSFVPEAPDPTQPDKTLEPLVIRAGYHAVFWLASGSCDLRRQAQRARCLGMDRETPDRHADIMRVQRADQLFPCTYMYGLPLA